MVNLWIVNEDRLLCNVPRKTIKACPCGGQGPSLSNLESGHAAPFSPQDFCSLCVCVYLNHNRSCGLGSASRMPYKAKCPFLFLNLSGLLGLLFYLVDRVPIHMYVRELKNTLKGKKQYIR